MSKIFLCHTSIDKPFVRKLAADLRRYNHTVWIDEAEINIGDSLIGKIREGLDDVDYVAVVLSKRSIGSEWVQKEIDIASNREIDEKKTIILPLMIEKVEMPGFLKGKFYGDFSDANKYQDGLNLLLRSLGDSQLIDEESDEDLQIIRKELEEARANISKLKRQSDKIIKYNLMNKSDALRSAIEDDNKRHPEYAPINNVYAFELGSVNMTLGYLRHVVTKAKMRDGHPVLLLLQIENKVELAERMVDAYRDMVEDK